MNLRTLFGHSAITISVLFLTACGGGSDWVQSDVSTSMPTYGIGGTVSGLDSGARITLSNNGSDSLSIGANGSFAFGTAVLYNGAYVVTVDKQPSTQTCTVSNGSGAGVVANVANINVTCSTTAFAVTGTVVGLAAGAQVTLQNNDSDATTRSADGNFSFATPVALNGGYAVTVQSQPWDKRVP